MQFNPPKKITLQVKLDPSIAKIYAEWRRKQGVTNERLFSDIAITLRERKIK